MTIEQLEQEYRLAREDAPKGDDVVLKKPVFTLCQRLDTGAEISDADNSLEDWLNEGWQILNVSYVREGTSTFRYVMIHHEYEEKSE